MRDGALTHQGREYDDYFLVPAYPALPIPSPGEPAPSPRLASLRPRGTGGVPLGPAIPRTPSPPSVDSH
jgi:hypothetical protein